MSKKNTVEFYRTDIEIMAMIGVEAKDAGMKLSVDDNCGMMLHLLDMSDPDDVPAKTIGGNLVYSEEPEAILQFIRGWTLAKLSPEDLLVAIT